MSGDSSRRLGVAPAAGDAGRQTLDDLLVATARGDEAAFARVYDGFAPSVFGLAKRVIRDPARAEEITQDVFLSVWKFATRFDPEKGSAQTWILTLTHRRAVDVVRAEEASTRRETRTRTYDPPFDTVSDQVTTRIEGEQVRRCLGALTELQREAVTLAYYGGYTYPEVSALLKVNGSTIKTRMRDGLIRLRDCLGG
ncbi:MAG: ECF RNA polymerase sigma factor SigK, partial [Nocardioidaceae bacterium]